MAGENNFFLKTFCNINSQKLEDAINNWFEKNPNYRIEDARLIFHEGSGDFSIMFVYYEELMQTRVSRFMCKLFKTLIEMEKEANTMLPYLPPIDFNWMEVINANNGYYGFLIIDMLLL